MSERRPGSRRPTPRAMATPSARRVEGRAVPLLRSARAVLRTEVLGLVRDRRALFLAFVLPTLLYPLLLWGQSWLERFSRSSMEAREVRIALDLRALDARAAAALRAELSSEGRIELVDVDASAVSALEPEISGEKPATTSERRAEVRKHFDAGLHALVVARSIAVEHAPFVRAYFDGSQDLSLEARRRAERALLRSQTALRGARLDERLGGDPASNLVPDPVDVASAADKGGAALARFLPLLAIFVLLGGASYAALAAFAGEREGGTLETLFVQPVPPLAIAAAKYAAVLGAGLLALALNLGSMLASAILGFGSLPGASAAVDGAPLPLARFALGAACLLPAAAFLCAVLCLVCGRARTFREGQNLILPLLLASLVPVLPATQPDVELDWFLACVPLTGPALALRDALRGELVLGPALVMFAASTAWAALPIARLASSLEAETLLGDPGTPEEDARRRVESRTALRFGVSGVFAVYLVGGSLQAWSLIAGLAATLWIVLLGLASWAASGAARRARTTKTAVLGLVRPSIAHCVGAVLVAPALALLVQRLFALQKEVLPLPASMEQVDLLPGLSSQGLALRLALLALSPAICEELFFRGAVLFGLRRDLAPGKAIAWQAALFAVMHGSIHRLAPTGMLGIVLGAIAVRGGSIVPCMLLHASYNGLLVASGDAPWLADPRLAWLALLGAPLLCLRGPRRA